MTKQQRDAADKSATRAAMHRDMASKLQSSEEKDTAAIIAKFYAENPGMEELAKQIQARMAKVGATAPKQAGKKYTPPVPWCAPPENPPRYFNKLSYPSSQMAVVPKTPSSQKAKDRDRRLEEMRQKGEQRRQAKQDANIRERSKPSELSLLTHITPTPSIVNKFTTKILNKITPYPPEVKKALAWLVVLEEKFNCPIFTKIHAIVGESVSKEPRMAVEKIIETGSVQFFVYALIVEISLLMIKSGEYHLYRGALNPLGPGRDLGFIVTQSIKELLRIEAIDQATAEQVMEGLHYCIEQSG